MSYSFLILDLNNEVNISSVNAELGNHFLDYEIIYCSSKKCNLNNVVSLEYNSAENQESVINDAVKHVSKVNMVVVRKFVSVDQIVKQTKSLLLNNQIVYYKKQASSFVSFFWKIFFYIAKFLFSKEIVFVNFCCVCYGEIATNILKKLEYPSNLMRSNQWQGIQLVGIEGGVKTKMENNVLKNSLLTFIPLVVAGVLITLFFVLKPKLGSLFKVIMWITSILCFIITIIFGTNWFIKCQIGENNFIKAKVKGEKKWKK